MAVPTIENVLDVRGPIGGRAVALANAKWFRSLAWRALRDGRPQGELRAANARAAARFALRQARRETVVGRMVANTLAAVG